MKKLLSLFIAFVTALMNNVGYTAGPDVQYTADSYYTVDEAEAPDYRNIYNNNAVVSKKVSCRTANYSAQGQRVQYTTDVTYFGYWFENSVKMKEDGLPKDKTYVFEEDGYIIAPFDCELISESTTNTGHDMIVKCTVGSNSYRLTISGMNRWYCCMGREDSVDVTDTEFIWEHTSKEQKGKKFNGGCVLGQGVNSKTTIVTEYIPPSGEPVPINISDFYLGITPQ